MIGARSHAARTTIPDLIVKITDSPGCLLISAVGASCGGVANHDAARYGGCVMPMEGLLREVARCRLCAPSLAHEPRPVISIGPDARVLIIGQAPGRKVHERGVPWFDPSGDRLRDWLQVDKDTFYDRSLFALMPMGFCFPGSGRNGDLPPRPECAPLWHTRLAALMPHVRLTLLVGQYAQRHYLAGRMGANLTETVRRFQDYAPLYFPLPHPSPRNQIWLKRNPWFARELLPVLRDRVRRVLPVATFPTQDGPA